MMPASLSPRENKRRTRAIQAQKLLRNCNQKGIYGNEVIRTVYAFVFLEKKDPAMNSDSIFFTQIVYLWYIFITDTLKRRSA